MNLDKGSRQNQSVTSGKGLALRVKHKVLCTNVATARGDYEKICESSGRSFDEVKDDSFGDFSLAR